MPESKQSCRPNFIITTQALVYAEGTGGGSDHVRTTFPVPRHSRLRSCTEYSQRPDQYRRRPAALSDIEAIADTLPVAAREQQLWWLAVFGATLQSYSLYLLALVHLGNRFKTPIAWGGLIAGIVLWAPQDLWFSLDAKLWLNLWIDGVALLTLLPPLFWLYRHDRRANASKNDAVHLSDTSANPFMGGAYKRVLVTGGTGFIGEALVNQLLDAGHSVSVLARDPLKAASLFDGRARCVRSLGKLGYDETFDVVINLAGAPVAGPRWSAERQAQLLASRVNTTEALMTWLKNPKHKPALWVQASAIGFYGVRDASESLDEGASKGGGFMAELCAKWEAAAPPDARQTRWLVARRLPIWRASGGAAIGRGVWSGR